LRARGEQGVTLLELVVVITIMALMLGLVVPHFGTWMDNWKLRSAAERVAQTIRDARTRAIYEQRYYVVELVPGESRVRMIEPVSGLVREYALPGDVQVDDGEGNSPSVVRLLFSPSGGMEERTLRLRNRQHREVDIHLNFLLGAPEVEISKQAVIGARGEADETGRLLR
jgi:prepilin-type N-terminal cleavage/methylation domain-containing protein